jgi:hypothetical protein
LGEAGPVDQQNATSRQLMDGVVEVLAIVAAVENNAFFAGCEQGLLLGLLAPVILLTPLVKDVPGRQPVGMFPKWIAGGVAWQVH